MREDAVSVRVQHTLKPELSGDVDGPRVDVLAPQNLEIRPAQSLPFSGRPKTNIPRKEPIRHEQSNRIS
jgi:hypothetical protein